MLQYGVACHSEAHEPRSNRQSLYTSSNFTTDPSNFTQTERVIAPFCRENDSEISVKQGELLHDFVVRTTVRVGV
jgi:hypothetical protein